jgi:hypothetical protein
MCAARYGTRAQLDVIAAPVLAAGEALAKAVASRRRLPRDRRYATPRIGPDTPRWNELARAVAAKLTHRGAKARLARELGISRQRLHVLVVARSAYPDAERALQLLEWLNRKIK